MTVKEQIILGSLAGAILIGSLALYVTQRADGSEEPAVEITPKPASVSASAAPIRGESIIPKKPSESLQLVDENVAEIVVSIAGAVHRPGVFRMRDTFRVDDLIQAAGGALDRADLSYINLAAPLVDGTTLTVPSRIDTITDENREELEREWENFLLNPAQYTLESQGRPAFAAQTAGASTTASNTSGDGLIHVNTATQAELETLPGIGPKYAQEIIRYREQHPFQTVDELTEVSGIGPKRLENIRPYVVVP